MNRAVQYDLIRIFVCLQIVMMHAPLPGSEADGLFLRKRKWTQFEKHFRNLKRK